jgi:hypothetical protein
MNNIIIVIPLIIAFVGILVGVIGLWCIGYSLLVWEEFNKKGFIASISAVLLGMILIIYLSIKYPQPSFREVCEANNGTYIDNNGRAGDSCIYNK